MRCFAALSMTRQESTHRCHAEPFGFAQDKLRAAESKHLIPWPVRNITELHRQEPKE